MVRSNIRKTACESKRQRNNTFIVGVYNCSKSLLTCSVPNLELNYLLVYGQ